MSDKLSSYAFAEYPTDGALYRGIHDLETQLAALKADKERLEGDGYCKCPASWWLGQVRGAKCTSCGKPTGREEGTTERKAINAARRQS